MDKKSIPSKASKVNSLASNQKVNKIQSNKIQIPMSNAQMQMQMQMPSQMQMPMPVSNSIQQTQTPQLYQQVPVRSIQGGVYGSRRQMEPQNYQTQIYNDDEPLIQKVKEQSKEIRIDFEIKAQRSLIKLKTKTQLPAMITLRTSGGNRSSVDLICVIDNSGSMQGEKINLVKQTIQFLLETLTPSDRLSIITFNSDSNRLCGLKCVTGENMQNFKNIISNIYAGGGTNINSGMQVALKIIRDRKHVNNVTSIFLLSDGQDRGAEARFKASLESNINKDLGVFSIHSFGFGTDHDQELMTKICELKDGAFYFIKELATLDEAFCNALGGIISLVANEVIIKLSNVAKNMVQGIKINKVYGKMWEKINQRQYKIKILQLMSGISKDYVFQLDIPAIDGEVGDVNRDHIVLNSLFEAKAINSQSIKGEKSLQLTLLNQNEVIPDTVQNVDVIQNYLRVKAAEAIEENLKKADEYKYEEAQKGIDHMIQYIQQNKKARKQKMESLVSDLNQIKEKCSKQSWQSQGRKYMKNAQQAHTMQNNYQYSNKMQSEMVAQVKSKKAKY